MRGRKQAQRQFVAMIDVNARIPRGHPIREIKRVSDEVFGRLGERFEAMYSEIGRPSIPPERLLSRAALGGPLQRAFRSGLLENGCATTCYSNGFWTWNSRKNLSMQAASAKTSNGSWNTKWPTSSWPKWSAYCGNETC